MRQALVFAVLLAGVVQVSVGQGINFDQVAADSAWLVHVDLDAFRSTRMGQLVGAEIAAKNPQRLAAVQELIGSDPTTDIRSLTLYGPDSEEKNVVSLIAGTFNRDKLTALLKLNGTYAEIPYRGRTLYSWVDDTRKKAQVGAFADENLIVISPSQEALQAALDVLDGRTPPLSGQSNALTGLKVPAGAFVVAAAEGPSNLAGDSHAAILKNSSLLMFATSEEAGNLKAHLQLESDTEESALQIENFVRGMMALALLKVKDQPQLAQLVQAAQVSRSGKSLAFDFSAPSEKLFELIKSHISLDLPLQTGQNTASAQPGDTHVP